MEIRLPYGRSFQTIQAPERNVQAILQAKHGVPKNKSTYIAERLKETYGPTLKELVPDKRGKTLVIVNDHTRQEDRITVLDQVTPNLGKYDLMIATGTHRNTTPSELAELLGPYYTNPKNKIFIHNCKDNLRFLGETKRGTPVHVNPKVLEYDLVVTVGVIEPHYFAGYAGPLGCCKSLSVGVAGYDTVEHNHRMAIENEAYCGRFENNPLAQDLSEISEIIEEEITLFCVGNLLKRWDIIDVFAGGRLTAFPAARKAMDRASRVTPKPADILIVSQGGYPRDLDLYQSQKSLEHTKYAVKRGGSIIWLAECELGLGHGLERISDVLEKPADSVMDNIR
ncbi:MAG: lactate racemase domain-containing protein, partial [Candidatus Ranarchaeia archaeon]